MSTWKLRPNTSKTKVMFFCSGASDQFCNVSLSCPGSSSTIDIVHEHKHLGIIIDDCLTWAPHVDYICKKTSSVLGILYPHRSHLPNTCRSMFYRSYLLPIFQYACQSWCSLSQHLEVE